MTVNKAEVERELVAGRQALEQVLSELSDEEILTPGVIDGWSVKDLLGHMAFWAQKAARDLEAVARGRPEEIEVPGSQEAVDAWNAREWERRKNKALVEVKNEWLSSFQAAKAALEAAPGEDLGREVKGWTVLQRFAEDTYNHYREHAAQIAAWRRELETTEA